MAVYTPDTATEPTLLAVLDALDDLEFNTTGLSKEATQLLVKANTDNLDALLSSRSSEATLLTRSSEATQLLVKVNTDNLDALLSSRASEAKQYEQRASEKTGRTPVHFSLFAGGTRVNTAGKTFYAESIRIAGERTVLVGGAAAQVFDAATERDRFFCPGALSNGALLGPASVQHGHLSEGRTYGREPLPFATNANVAAPGFSSFIAFFGGYEE